MRRPIEALGRLVKELARDEAGMPPPQNPLPLLIILVLGIESVVCGLIRRIPGPLADAPAKDLLIWGIVLGGATAVTTAVVYEGRDSLRRAARRVRDRLVGEESGTEDG